MVDCTALAAIELSSTIKILVVASVVSPAFALSSLAAGVTLGIAFG
jgi:hypothetical protein